MARLRFTADQIREVEGARAERMERAPGEGTNVTVRLLAQVVGVGVETADMLVTSYCQNSQSLAEGGHPHMQHGA